MPDIDAFKSLLRRSHRIVGFTGAGISTESGIPDYRSQGGIWKKFQPVYFDEFVANEEKRLLYWERKKELWQGLQKARPGITHLFFKKLYDNGRLKGIITQNIDDLHEISGLPGDALVNLHGTSLEIICLECQNITPSQAMFDALDLSCGAPRCRQCNGLLKPNTISFGQSLRPQDLQRAQDLALNCDLMLAMGSTLIVQPAASFPVIAKKNGAKLAIITQSETPLDKIADFISHEKLGDFIDRLSDG